MYQDTEWFISLYSFITNSSRHFAFFMLIVHNTVFYFQLEKNENLLCEIKAFVSANQFNSIHILFLCCLFHKHGAYAMKVWTLSYWGLPELTSCWKISEQYRLEDIQKVAETPLLLLKKGKKHYSVILFHSSNIIFMNYSVLFTLFIMTNGFS